MAGAEIFFVLKHYVITQKGSCFIRLLPCFLYKLLGAGAGPGRLGGRTWRSARGRTESPFTAPLLNGAPHG